MTPAIASAIFRIGGLILSGAGFLASLPLAFLTLVFVGNFRFTDIVQLAVFVVTLSGSLSSLAAGIAFQIRPAKRSFLMILASNVMVGGTWIFWLTALPRNLIH